MYKVLKGKDDGGAAYFKPICTSEHEEFKMAKMALIRQGHGWIKDDNGNEYGQYDGDSWYKINKDKAGELEII